MPRFLLFAAILWTCSLPLAGAAPQQSEYTLADPKLKVVVLDTSPGESFFSVRADTMGRLFVGGREGLFVYEPKADGSYAPRQELYRFPPDTWVNDIAIRGDDLYVSTVAAIYVIPGGVTKRDGLKPRRILWGVPLGHVHQCFHALAWGPEGDLYISMGDPYVGYGDFNRPDHFVFFTFFNRPLGADQPVATPYHGVGGVFRLRPDGSNFKVIAGGLRNACGLVFDSHWNLFSNDNDHESLPVQYVPGRLVHVTPGAQFFWPRGWMPSKTPERMDLLQTMNDTLGRYVPVGQSYYDDSFLPGLQNNLLVARWCIGAITRYPIEPRGASFKASEFELLQGHDQARPVNVSVGRGGRIFATVAYMAQNEGSPVYKGDLVMITRADDPPSAPFEAYDVTKLTLHELFEELKHVDWSRRQVAHQEILRRVPEGPMVAATLSFEPGRPAQQREHLIWLGLAPGLSMSNAMMGKWKGDDPAAAKKLRIQVARAFAEQGDGSFRYSESAIMPPDAPPDLQLALLSGVTDEFDRKVAGVLTAPARSADTYLRQTATLLLARNRKTTVLDLAKLCSDDDAALRLAGVLATGFRLTVPEATSPLPTGLHVEPLKGETPYVIQYADEKLDLRKFGPIGNYTMAERWKQVTHSADDEALFALLREKLTDTAEPVRLQAAYFLSLLNDPRSEPEVAKVVEANEERRLSLAKMTNVGKLWMIGPFDDGDDGFLREHPPERGAVDLAKSYPGRGGEVKWQQVSAKRNFDLGEQYGNIDRSSVYAYVRLQSPARTRIHVLIGSNDGVRVWNNGRVVWTNDVARIALPLQDMVTVPLEPGSNDLLIRVRNREGDSALYLHYRSLLNVTHTLPQPLDVAGLAERLKSASTGATAIPPEFLTVDWSKAAGQGNVARGKQLFEAIGCAKCHAISADSPGSGGPSLADAGRRFTVPHLVESVLLPSKQISPIFRATHLVLHDGRQLTGLIVGETAEKLELLQADTKKADIPKADIEERTLLEQSPMPQGVVKKPDELRDLLAFLLDAGKQPQGK